MGVGSGVPRHLWIFIHSTDKVEGGLMVLFFDLVFFRYPCASNQIFVNASFEVETFEKIFGRTDTKLQ